jgi:hypothetical protein
VIDAELVADFAAGDVSAKTAAELDKSSFALTCLAASTSDSISSRRPG